jgi:HK97 family phage portal protein
MGILRTIANKLSRKSVSIHRLNDWVSSYGKTESGAVVNEDTSMRQATVYSCVRVLAESIAVLPLILYQRGEGANRHRHYDHSLYRVLHDQPNSWQTAFDFKCMMMWHLVLRGNAYAFINKVNGIRKKDFELIPIHPDAVEVKVSEDFEITYEVLSTKGIKEYKQDEILHIRGITLDGFRGISPIAYHRETVGLSMSAEKFGSRHFGNSARPSGVLTTPQDIKNVDQNKLGETWRKAYSGNNSHRVAILSNGLEFKPISMTAEDSQYLETRQFQRTEICAIFGVPPHKIGDLSRATFSNIEHQSMEFVRDSVLPWAVRWEQVIPRDLFTKQERNKMFVEFLMNSALRADIGTRTKAYASQINWGIMSPNEARALENMNPREGGDIYLTPTNMTTKPGEEGMKDEKQN